MRIGLFTDTYLPNINGVVTSVENLRKSLERMGHEVYVVCTYPGFLHVEREGNIIRLPGMKVKQLYGYSLAQPLHMMLVDDIRDLQLDIIHCHTEFGVGLFASYCAKELHIPLVRTYHTTYEDYTHYINPVDSETLDSGLKKAVSYLSKIYGNDCVRLISPSKKTKELLESYNVKTPIDIIPTGVEIERFRKTDHPAELYERVRKEYDRKGNEKIFLYVGRIAEEKSIDLLLRTFAILKEDGYPDRLIIIGDGPGRKDLEELKGKLKLDNVFFLGSRPNTEIPVYYQCADCFLSASTSETQGMTYIEALSASIPVMGRYDEALDGLIQEDVNGYFFSDEEELAAKIEGFLSLEDEEVKKMKENASNSTREYDLQVFGQRVLETYQKAMEEYDSFYTVSKVTLKDNYVVIRVKNGEGEEEKISVDLDTYYQEGLRNGQKISSASYDHLKEEEVKTLAYTAALRRLSNKDYTLAGMRKYLDTRYEIALKDREEIIAKLKELGLLDDRKYAYQRFESLNRALFSRRQIASKLRKDGVPSDIVDECLQENRSDESCKARQRAEKIQNSLRNKPLSMKKQLILKHLVSDGFSIETAKEALETLDFSSETFEEKDLLKREAQKQYKKLSRKYSGTELRNRLYYSLISKGFAQEKVYAVIGEMEEGI